MLMLKNNLVSSLIVLSSLSVAIDAKAIVDCRVLTHTNNICNPYGSKLIRTKMVSDNYLNTHLVYEKRKHPIQTQSSTTIIPVALVKREPTYIHDSLRYKEENEIINISGNVDADIVAIPSYEKSKVQYGMYTIQSGDVLGRVAHKFGLSLSELLKINKLEKDATIKINQKIKLPFSQKMVNTITTGKYKILQGDTLLSIAHRFKLDPKEIVSFNHLKSSAMIREGQILDLPFAYITKALDKIKELEAQKRKLALEKKKEELKAKKQRIRATFNHNHKKMYLGSRKHKLRVTATAYSSHRGQTDSTPFLAAWNNRIRPGMKIIAVSRDLLTRYGLRNGSKVKIGGLRGYYRVRDKMNKRFRKRIDIYMGVNRRRALRWGRRSVVIYW